MVAVLQKQAWKRSRYSTIKPEWIRLRIELNYLEQPTYYKIN